MMKTKRAHELLIVKTTEKGRTKRMPVNANICKQTMVFLMRITLRLDLDLMLQEKSKYLRIKKWERTPTAALIRFVYIGFIFFSLGKMKLIGQSSCDRPIKIKPKF